jgi:hypothetical protein
MFTHPFFIAGLIALVLGLAGLFLQKTLSLGKSLGPTRIIDRAANPTEFWSYETFYLILGVLLIAVAFFDRA